MRLLVFLTIFSAVFLIFIKYITGKQVYGEKIPNIPYKSERRLEIVFQRMDLNKDSLIERSELRKWILRGFKLITELTIKDNFIDTDMNKDHKITWIEYSTNTKIPNQSKKLNDIEELYYNQLIFNISDLNKDGYLNLYEFIITSIPEEFDFMTSVLLNYTLDHYDLNKDKSIDFNEFISENIQYQSHNDIKQKEFDFIAIDKDHNKLLQGEEIISWYHPIHEELTSDEANHLFDTSDINEDDYLTLDEILENYKLFVDSEAIKYGDKYLHLKK